MTRHCNVYYKPSGVCGGDEDGPEPQSQQQVKVLNRIVSWTSNGPEFQADPGHAEFTAGELGFKILEGCTFAWNQRGGTHKTSS